jgi:hypothetical protein
MRQGQDLVSVNVLVMPHITGNHRQASIDPAKEGLNLDHLGNVAGCGDEIVKGPRIGLVQRDPK